VKFLPHSTLSLVFLFLFLSCEFDKVELGLEKICVNKGATLPPDGYQMDEIGSFPTFSGKMLLFQFLDDKIGFALGSDHFGDAKCFKTSNGGKQWTRLVFNTPHSPRGMIFFDGSAGIITLEDPQGCPPNCPEQCIMLRTQDGGEHWEEYVVPNLTGSFSHLQLDSQGKVYAFLKDQFTSTLMFSDDQGLTWNTFVASTSFELDDELLKIVNDRIYVLDRNQVMLVLNIDGAPTKAVQTGGIFPRDLEVIDNDHFIIAGINGITRSNDGGETWETIFDRHARLIGFSSFDHGLVILNKCNCPQGYFPANEVIASTFDGGQTWIESPANMNILQHYVLSEQIGFDRFLIMIGDWVYELKSS
jgi:photosystem II stability/assembly factor-like uncharacterized protein